MNKDDLHNIAYKTVELYPKAKNLKHLADLVKEEIPTASDGQIWLASLTVDAVVDIHFGFKDGSLNYTGGLE